MIARNSMKELLSVKKKKKRVGAKIILVFKFKLEMCDLDPINII